MRRLVKVIQMLEDTFFKGIPSNAEVISVATSKGGPRVWTLLIRVGETQVWNPAVNPDSDYPSYRKRWDKRICHPEKYGVEVDTLTPHRGNRGPGMLEQYGFTSYDLPHDGFENCCMHSKHHMNGWKDKSKARKQWARHQDRHKDTAHIHYTTK